MLSTLPPPQTMDPNVLIIVKLPTDIYKELSEMGTFEEFRHAVFSIAELELNIISTLPAKVSVLLESQEKQTKRTKL